MGQLAESGVRQRPGWLYEEPDQLRELRRRAKQAMLTESRTHQAVGLFEIDSSALL